MRVRYRRRLDPESTAACGGSGSNRSPTERGERRTYERHADGRWMDRRDTSLASTFVMKPLHVCLVYNAYAPPGQEAADDRGGTADLRKMIRHMARALRTLGHTVTVLPLAHDLFGFQRKLRRLQPDVVF